MSAPLEPGPHPLRDRPPRHRDVFVGDGRQAADLAVRRRSVAVDTAQAAFVLEVAAAYALQPDVVDDIIVAADEVLLHHTHPRLAHAAALRLEPPSAPRRGAAPSRILLP